MPTEPSTTSDAGRAPDSVPSRSKGEQFGRDPFWVAKREGTAYHAPKQYSDIEFPRNNAMAVASGLIAGFVLGFGLAWQIWWLVIVGCIWGAVTIVWYGFTRSKDDTIPAGEVETETVHWLNAVKAAKPVTRDDETTPANDGVAARNHAAVIVDSPLQELKSRFEESRNG